MIHFKEYALVSTPLSFPKNYGNNKGNIFLKLINMTPAWFPLHFDLAQVEAIRGNIVR